MYEFSKRLFDIMLSLLGLLMLLPAFAVIGVLVKLGSPGPVFYRGVRSGRQGRPFRIFKFRTMVADAEKGPGSTAQGDSRITAIGQVLRRYKLDELPQLFNVLGGEMSFVGPRPELPRYTAQYSGDELLILSVRPGITDYSSLHFIQLSDVLGTGDPDRAFEEKVLPAKNRLRIQYVRERGFLLDLQLIIRTVFKIGKREWNTPVSARPNCE
jgi:lipopolysaccharide/colanic/teichoic acid biosynthesis glycosyltransferase